MTPLDLAHQAMTNAPEDDRLRLAYYEALAAAELVLMIEDELPEAVRPRVFTTEEARMALAFDGEERLAAFSGEPTAYAALPGRALVGLLAGSGVGLGVNLTADSAFLMPAEAVDWLAATLARSPVAETGRPESVSAPGLPDRLVAALDRRLARAAGLASRAYLVSATWAEARQGHLMVIVDAAPGAEAALAQAIGEAVIFAGEEAGSLDLAFLAGTDLFVARLERVALRFDLPEMEVTGPSAPGTDPGRPPRLR